MATVKFEPANKYSEYVTVAQAAVTWARLSPEQIELLVVEDGMPFLAGNQDLTDRARAIYDAAVHGFISGRIRNEDGYELKPELMRLSVASVAKWTAKVDARIGAAIEKSAEAAPPGERLLKESEVLVKLGISRTTLFRRITAGEIEAAHFEKPNRWRLSYIESLQK